MAKPKKSLVWLILIVIVVVIAWLALRPKGSGEKPASGGILPPAVSLSKSGFQAVVMDNDQIYVGKVEDPNDQFVKVNEAYRLIASQSQDKGSTDLKVIKLEEGIHGPTNTIFINRDHIAIVEDLRSNSPLIEIIKNYQPAPKK